MQEVNKKEVSIDEDFKVSSWESVSGACHIQRFMRGNLYKIEIVENKPLARMLYHNVELGEQIPPELYQMVAEILAYVYGLQGKVS